MGLPDGFQVEPEVDQHLLRDDRRQESVQRLLGATIGVIRQVREGVDQGAGKGRGVPHLEPGSVRIAVGGDAEDDLPLLMIRPDRAGGRLRLEHAVNIGRELI